jgi:hypothetical protein
MSFGVPTALLWSLLVIPVIALYILKVRLRRVPTSTTMFWNQIFDEKPPRSIWETLKHLLSLLAQLAILAFLVLSVADPYLPGQLKASRRIVVVVDNSASMRATDVDPSRLAAAKKKAVSLVEGLRFGDEMAVILAGDHPTVALGMSGHAPTLKRTIEAITPTDCPSSIQPAIDLGRRLIGTHPHGQLVVLTDGCSPGSETLLGQKDVALEIIGTPAGNVGITQFQVRRSLVDPLGYEVLTAVSNASDGPVEGRLELELGGVTVDILPLKLAPGETWTRSLEKTSLEGGRLTAALTKMTSPAAEGSEAKEFQDPLASDDRAYAILPPRKIQNVLLVTPGNLFLQKVFEANRLVNLTVVKELPTEWPLDTVVVLHRLVPEKLLPRDILVIDPDGPSEAWQLGDLLENPIITQQDAASPLMTHLKLDNVTMPKARRLTFTDQPHILAGAVSGEPVYASFQRTSPLKGLVLPVSLDEGDLTFRTAFPIMVANALSWFGGSSGELQPAVATGAIVHMALEGVKPDGHDPLNVLTPSGAKKPVVLAPVVAGDDKPPAATIGPLEEIGIWEVGEGETDPKVVAATAVNLSNPLESDLRAPDSVRQAVHQPLLAASLFTRPLWYYLAILALVLATVEWFLYQRRWIR